MSRVLSSARCREPIFPLVEDLECSPEWMGLTCDINNLERMKSRGRIRGVKPEDIATTSHRGQLINRRPMSEVTEPSLVYVHLTTTNENLHLKSSSRVRDNDQRWSWRPCTEFERSYFHDNNATDIDKALARGESRRSYRESAEDCDRLEIEVENGVSKGSAGGSVVRMDSPSFHDKRSHSGGVGGSSSHEVDKPADILFRPGSDEFRGSRERLHEIFEHNRLLRRRFFADMPDSGDEPKDFPCKGMCGQIEMIKSRVEMPVKHISGFGSTETLTSQSNQSGASSTNGRKSASVDFEHSRESTIFDDCKVPEGLLSPIDIKAQSNGLSVVRDVNRSPIETVSFEYRHLPSQSLARVSNYTDNRSKSRERLGDSGLPTIQTVDYEDCYGGDIEEKFFATYVRIQDSPNTTQTADVSLREKRNRPEPLDLAGVNRTYSEIHEQERRMMKNYTVEVTPLRQDDDEQSRCVNLTVLENERNSSKNLNDQDDIKCSLRASKSLLELPTKSKSSSLATKINILSERKRTNKSCSDLSMVEDLRSPQLVNSFSNSMMDLHVHEPHQGERSRQFNEDDVDADRGKSIGSSTPGTGTTLPLVYGPIPYKSPRRYVEGEVTIHYRSPVRTEAKEILSEEELARRSAENMRRVYQEERRRKYLQELHDIDSRRHTDNFIPSQKSPIPLNRYDDFLDDLSYRSRSQEQTPEPRLVARAMYNFVGQTSRELSFRRGDIILIRRQIDKNWYEGEHNAMVGLFPLNYIEILPYDGARSTPKKPYEGQARAKFNFIAQTNLELSLAKGELVVLTRRVDDNWFEGRIGNKKGIFPVTYVEIIVEPGQHRPETPVSSKPVASPAAHSMLSNGTASGKLSMGPHHYTPSIPVKTSTTEPQYISLPRIGVTERNKLHVAPVNETLHIDTHSDTIPYRALYNYRPQNEDELELKEGDTVYVMEKCDDGWYVGSSQRTGYFGTFPGNYVERL